MLFIVYGATLDLGYETRCIFKKKKFEIITKYNFVRDDSKVDKKNYENTSNSNEWFQKWYDDKVYVSENEMSLLDFTYELDGVCVGFNQKQIMEAVHGVKNALITLGASSLGFISEIKAAYGDYITVINLFEDIKTVEESVIKYGAFSEREKKTRVDANKKMQKLYLENNTIFDEVVMYTGEDTCYDLEGLERQYDSIIKNREEIQKKLNNNKYVALPYNGAEPYIFISYAHNDREVVHNALLFLQRNSFRIWYDDGIAWGSNWQKMINDKIQKSECVILFSSKNSVESEYVQDEIIEAWTHLKKIYTIKLDEETFASSFEKRLGKNQKISIDELKNKFIDTLPETTRNRNN